MTRVLITSLAYHTHQSDKDIPIAEIFTVLIKTKNHVYCEHEDFEEMFQNVLCPLCKLHEDTIPNLLECQDIMAVPRNGAIYNDIFSPSVDIQRNAMLQFRALLQARDRILDWEEEEEEESA